MKKRLLVFTLVGLTACKYNPAIQEHEFHYYPAKNVYYDVEGRKFLYSLDGGESWRETKVSQEPEGLLGKMITLSDTSRQIFSQNPAHRKLYNGVLFSLPPADTSTALIAEVSERKIPKAKAPAISQKPSAQETPKKGLGKFFSRIFGKKHKKE